MCPGGSPAFFWQNRITVLAMVLRPGWGCHLCRLFSLLLLFETYFFPPPPLRAVAISFFGSLQVSPETEDRLLQDGAVVAGTIRFGEIHRYRLPLAAGEYVHLAVLQQGVDLVVSFFGPDGRKLVERDDVATAERVAERVSWVAALDGLYRAEVRCFDKEAPEGRYELRARVRPAVAGDSDEVVAEADLDEGLKLQAQTGSQFRRPALDKLQKALAFWKQRGDVERQSITHQSLGHVYSALSDYPNALAHYTQAFSANQSLGDSVGEAYALFSMATIEATLDRSSEAFEHYHRALDIERKRGDQRMEAMILSNLGKLHDEVGQKEKALEMFERALPLIRSTRNLPFEARTVNRLGALYQSEGEQQKAITFYLQALELAKSLKDDQLAGSILASIGRAYTDLGDPDQGLRCLLGALEMVRSAADRHAEARILPEIGRVFAEREDVTQALKYDEEALELLRGIGDPRGQAGVLNSIGQLHLKASRLTEAKASFDQALEIARRASDPYREADALTNRGRVHASMGEAAEALDDFRRADSLRKEVHDRQGEAWTAYETAKLQLELGHLPEARVLAEQALAALDSLRGQVLDPELRASFFVSARKCYELYINVLQKWDRREPSGNFSALALLASEQARARSLLDLLSEARVNVREGADAALLAREKSLRRELNSRIERQIRLTSKKSSESEAAALAGEIESLRTQLRDLESEIRAKSPQYASLALPQPLGLAEIQRQVLDSETLLIEYFLGEERSFLWAVGAASVAAYELPGRIEIETAARRFYDALTERNRRNKSESVTHRSARIRRSDEEYPRAGKALSEMLLGPLRSELVKKRLVIVADGALQYLPFAALPDPGRETTPGEGMPLIANHEVVNLPSASVLVALRQELAGRKPRPKTLAVLADPVFEKQDERVEGSARLRKRAQPAAAGSPKAEIAEESELLRSAVDTGVSGQGSLSIPRLLFTRTEAQAILSLVPGPLRREALDFEASRTTAQDPDLSGYRFVHFATHGLLDSRHPELSGLVLSLVDKKGSPQPGFLTAAEVFNLHLPADLVVLSGCQTALGKEIRGEGLVGLTRAFFYAGTARVVASLWRVDDMATAELMTLFYGGMLGARKLSAAAALRSAQLELSARKRWSAPYYWAGFVLQGEWK